MLIADVPVQASQDRGILSTDIITDITLPDASIFLIFIDNGLCQIGCHKVSVHASIVGSRIFLDATFQTSEEEQLVLNNRTTNGKSVGLFLLVLQLFGLALQLIIATI